MPHRFRLTAVSLALASLAGPAFAQGVRVAGVVHDAESRAPLEEVAVGAGARTVFTDGAGRFALTLTSDTVMVEFRRIGYRSVRLRATELGGEVLLAPEPTRLGSIAAEAPRANELAVGTALAVTGIDREGIMARSGNSLAEALEGVPGVTTQRPGAWGANAMLRGLGADRVAVMIDGARVNRSCPFAMDQGLATIMPEAVERVEILSGPGSTLYGSGNIGGVINVVTRRPESARAIAGELRAGASSAVPGGTLGGSLRLRNGATDLALAADGASFGDYRTPEGRVAASSYRDLNLDAKLGYRMRGGQRLALEAQDYEGRDIGYPAMVANIPTQTRRSLAADYAWQAGRGFVDALSARVYVQSLGHRMSMRMIMDTLMGTTLDLQDRARSVTSGARAQVRLLPARGTHLDAGVETVRWTANATRLQSMSDPSAMTADSAALRIWPGVRVLDIGAFAQGEARVAPGLTLSAGGRTDRVVKRADSVATRREWIGTGNVGLRAAVGSGFGVRASLGYGYRIPSASELSGLDLRMDGNIYRGNPDLKTETNRNLEVALTWDAGTVSATATVFQNDLSGLIVADLVPGDSIAGLAAGVFRNIPRARLTGGTAALRTQTGRRVRADASLTYTRGEALASGAPLPLIPPLEGTVSITLSSAGAAWFKVEGRAGSEQRRVAASAGEDVTPSFGVLDLRMGLPVRHADVVVGIDNVFNERYRHHVDPAGILRPARGVSLRVRREL